MGSFEHGAQTNNQAEKAAREAMSGTLEELKEEIGSEMYENIIAKLSTGDVNDLNEEEKSIISRIKKDKIGPTH